MTDPKSLIAWSNAAFRRWCARRGIDPATVQVIGSWAHLTTGDYTLPLPEGQQKTKDEAKDVKQNDSGTG